MGPGCRDAADAQAERVGALVRARDYAGLLELSQGADEPLACRAAWALAWSRAREAIPGHVALLRYERCDWMIRTEAMWRLAEEGATEAGPAIAEQLRDASPVVRWNAARVLGELKAPATLEPLRGCLADANKLVAAWCRWAACQVAGKGGCPKKPNMDHTTGKPVP